MISLSKTGTRYLQKFCQRHWGEMVSLQRRERAGERYRDNNGYVHVHLSDGNTVLEHRYIMEQEIGRSLKSHEHVHHINHIKDDNRPCNLIIMSPQAHGRTHNWLFNRTRRLGSRAINFVTHPPAL